MGYFDMDKNSLPEQVQENKDKIKELDTGKASIDYVDEKDADNLQAAKDYTDDHVVDADHITSDNAASGKILTADGDGGVAWDDPSSIKASDVNSESEPSGKVLTTDGTGGATWENPTTPTITASNIDSESATAGKVLSADGNGGAIWADGAGGLSLVWSGNLQLTSTYASIGSITLEPDIMYKLVFANNAVLDIMLNPYDMDADYYQGGCFLQYREVNTDIRFYTITYSLSTNKIKVNYCKKLAFADNTISSIGGNVNLLKVYKY